MFGDEPPPFDQMDELVATADQSDDASFVVQIGGLCYFDDRFADTRRLWERGFGLLRAAGDDRAAARVAVNLIDLHGALLGNMAASRGWAAKARRLLEAIGPCVEWGWFDLAYAACFRPDVDDLLASTERALALAAEFDDSDLEVRALADAGLALVSQGRCEDGFARLDEALATICAGQVHDPGVAGLAFCSMLSSCDRAQEVGRAEEWVRLVDELILRPTDGRPPILTTHCRAAYGSVLIGAGRLAEAEVALSEALGPESSTCVAHRLESTAALARLRIVQGRIDEAAELLAPQADRLATCLPMAEVHLRRGEPELAVAVARRGISELIGDTSRRTPLLGLVVEAEIAAGNLAGAAEAVAELDAISQGTGIVGLEAGRALARGRLVAAEGDLAASISEFEVGLASLEVDSDRVIAGQLRLELAIALAEAGSPASAIAQARAAHALFERLGAVGWSERTAVVLRSLGTAAPTAAVDGASSVLDPLTEREREVLRLVCRGSTNAEIGEQLFIAPKTVEHHVGRILSKLGVRSRTEAAALAASIGPSPTP